jgi:hypothetical protein
MGFFEQYHPVTITSNMPTTETSDGISGKETEIRNLSMSRVPRDLFGTFLIQHHLRLHNPDCGDEMHN